MIEDTDDFLCEYNLRQPEADHLRRLFDARDKVGILKLLKNKGVNPENLEQYYAIMLKDFDKSFKIVEDNSFLQDDNSFLKLRGLKFLFSTGLSPIKGFMMDGRVYGGDDIFNRKQIKQVWIIQSSD